MNKLIGCKVFGNWGDAGCEDGVIINVLTDSLGTDIVIEWEDGRHQNVDIKDAIEINEDTDIHTIGIYVDVRGNISAQIQIDKLISMIKKLQNLIRSRTSTTIIHIMTSTNFKH